MACPDVKQAAKIEAGELKTTAHSQMDEDLRLGNLQASAHVQTTVVQRDRQCSLCGALLRPPTHRWKRRLSSPLAICDAYSLPGAGRDSTAHAPGRSRLLGIRLRNRPPINCAHAISRMRQIQKERICDSCRDIANPAAAAARAIQHQTACWGCVSCIKCMRAILGSAHRPLLPSA